MKTPFKTRADALGLNPVLSYQRLPNIFYQNAQPQALDAYQTFYVNESLMASLGLPWPKEEAAMASFFAGQTTFSDHTPIAQAYAGHQFGHFTVLGDGRAVLLAEMDHQGQTYDLHLKGSGPTPFARRGDGQATLFAMLKEALISEALHGLGLPTTRSLLVGLTGLEVPRETPQPGAYQVRLAKSHVRVGTFEWAAMHQDRSHLEALLAYAIKRHDQDLDPSDALGFLRRVITRQANLIALWQSVGFVHGVMNTDNMAISGETIDYGPCAFLDTYRPNQTFSSIDTHGRYAYNQQPYIASWNLARLAVSLLPLISDEQAKAVALATEALETFGPTFEAAYAKKMSAKFGFLNATQDDLQHINQFFDLMHQHARDFTETFLELTFDRYEDAFYQKADVASWVRWYQKRKTQEVDAFKLQKQHNPALIPRNITVERLLKTVSLTKDITPFKQYLDLLKNPYQHTEAQAVHQGPPKNNPTKFVTTCGT